MITFKQMDALIWIVNMGGFEAAADKLNMSQSAVSKRIHELEDSFGIEIFDRSSRNARLTEKGRELFFYCQELIDKRNQLIERVSDSNVLLAEIRLGVTELTSITWLPILIQKIKEAYPRVQIIPTVDASPNLYNFLQNDKLDIIVAPDIYDDVRLHSFFLTSVENSWMCSSTLIPSHEKPDIEQAGKHSFFVQGTASGTGLIYERYFSMRGIKFDRNIICNNLFAQIGLTVAGMGITYLPHRPLRTLLDKGILRELDFRPKLPLVRYSAVYRSDRQKGIIPHIAEIAKGCCNFDKFLFGT